MLKSFLRKLQLMNNNNKKKEDPSQLHKFY